MSVWMHLSFVVIRSWMYARVYVWIFMALIFFYSLFFFSNPLMRDKTLLVPRPSVFLWCKTLTPQNYKNRGVFDQSENGYSRVFIAAIDYWTWLATLVPDYLPLFGHEHLSTTAISKTLVYSTHVPGEGTKASIKEAYNYFCFNVD